MPSAHLSSNQLTQPIDPAGHRVSLICHIRGRAVSFNLQRPLPGAGFGGMLRYSERPDAHHLVAAAEAEPDALPRALADCSGLLLLPDMQAMTEASDLLVRLSRIFGNEVEDYRQTLTPLNMVHSTVPEIFIVANRPPASRPRPRRPDPAFNP